MERHVTISAYWLQRQITAGLVMMLTSSLLAQTTPPAASQQGGAATAGPVQTDSRPTGQPTPQTSQPAQEAPQPVGAAVAPYEKTVGAASSRPAGAVIAPAKQRRAHSVLIKVALIAAGAAAIGTVVALSKASSSRPN